DGRFEPSRRYAAANVSEVGRRVLSIRTVRCDRARVTDRIAGRVKSRHVCFGSTASLGARDWRRNGARRSEGMDMRRRDFITAIAATAASWPLLAGAQAALTQAQSDALAAYEKALNQFRSILRERRAQLSSHQALPDRPGQPLYLARVAMMSAYKDLTDALPSKIGRPNKYAIPPAYFDADAEPLLDEYVTLFGIMQAPPANAQSSATPFHDVVDLGTAIARAKGLDAANAEAAGRIRL